ncbi:RNA polymerase sigma factor [Chitinophaga agrisoli]|uniref:RNA polymerase sigma factor n=1 Tax=Chitinophaga agrisoli TaxID=2607653 RepID=UPI001661E82E|nr:sigma-70 family RNA polymerase sigma factor [Chitinophaga agrisoli]
MKTLLINLSAHTADYHDACDNLDQILDGCRRSDRLCQEKLYYLYFDRMLGVIRRYTTDQDQGVDILNNGFLRAFQKIAQYQHSGSFEGWLRRIIVHAVADYFRSAQAQQKERSVADVPEDLATVHADNRLEYKDLLQALELLPPTTRVVINLFIIDGYSHKEIATMLNISTGTSKWHVAEGKRLLKEHVTAQQNVFNNNKAV